MRYLCLVYLNESALAQIPAAAREGLDVECCVYGEQLRGSGQLVAGEALQPVQSATTLQRQGQSFSLRDGPVVDTAEQLAAFYLFEAADLNDAILLASRIPPGRYGHVEVRAIHQRAPP